MPMQRIATLAGIDLPIQFSYRPYVPRKRKSVTPTANAVVIQYANPAIVHGDSTLGFTLPAITGNEYQSIYDIYRNGGDLLFTGYWGERLVVRFDQLDDPTVTGRMFHLSGQFQVVAETLEQLVSCGLSVGAEFDYDLIDTMVLSLLAETGVENAAGEAPSAGDAIAAWRDQSSAGNDALQAFNPSRPLYRLDVSTTGKPALEYIDIGLMSLDSAIDFLSNPFWIAWVEDFTAQGGAIMSHSTLNNNFSHISSGNIQVVSDPATTVNLPIKDIGVGQHTSMLIRDLSDNLLYYSDGLIRDFTGFSTNWVLDQIGLQKGHIFEMMVAKSEPDDDLRNNYGKFLGAKYGTDWFNNSMMSDIASYWKLEEATGVSKVDEFGIIPLLDTGGQSVPFTASGFFGGGCEFSSPVSEHNLSVPNASLGSLNPSAGFPFSMAFWVKTDSLTALQTVMGIWTESGDERSWKVLLDITTGNAEFWISSDGTAVNTRAAVSTGPEAEVGVWTFIYIEFDPGTGDVGIRTGNGSTLGSLDTAAAVDDFNSGTTADFIIGGNNGGTNEKFDGKIDEIGLWERTLTSAEVTDLFNSGNGRQVPFE